MHVLITGGAGFLGQRLARKLLERPDLSSLTLADIVTPPNPAGDPRVRAVQADITDQDVVRSLVTPELQATYHLAAVVSSAAEADFDLGMRVNVDATRHLLEAARHRAPGSRFVFTSSIAVFGGTLPDVVTDQTAVNPQSSYGMQKAVGELLVNDYARKGFLDGRVVRLPTISVRPGRPNRAASSFVSGIIREPLQGEEAVCPVAPGVPVWLSGPGTVTDNLARALDVSAQALGNNRTVNLPGITVTVQGMLDALRRVAGEQVVQRVRFEPDETIERIVSSWPGAFDTGRATALGFTADQDFDSIVRAFVEHDLAR